MYTIIDPSITTPQREKTESDLLMIPTPDLSHLTKNDYERVYEPAGEEHCIQRLVWLDRAL